MSIQIILTNYLLQFMYGDRAFQDPLLLSREVLKKAHSEGLYYISSKEMINRIVKTKTFPKNIFLFAGIPTTEEISLTHTIKPILYALKITLPYEVLADFVYTDEYQDTCLYKDNIDDKLFLFEKVTLHSIMIEHKPFYEERLWEDNEIDFTEDCHEEMISYFSHKLKQYDFAIKRKLDFLKEEWNQFLNSELSLAYLEDKDKLEFIKDCYEEIVYDSAKKM